jgi:hypothetical protein
MLGLPFLVGRFLVGHSLVVNRVRMGPILLIRILNLIGQDELTMMTALSKVKPRSAQPSRPDFPKTNRKFPVIKA